MDRPIYARVCKTEKEWDSALMAMQMCGADNIKKHGYPLQITVSLWKPKRSEQQSRYLWGCVYATISQETGNDINSLHEYYLGSFFGWQELHVFDKIKLIPRERSSKQVKARFSEFIEHVTAHAATLGIVVPPPLTDKTW